MVYEYALITFIEGMDCEYARVREVPVSGNLPLRLTLTVVSSTTLEDQDLDALKYKIEGVVNRSF